jgi:iron complex outermembrane receptor protein
MSFRSLACAAMALACLPLASADDEAKPSAGSVDDTVLVIGQRDSPMTVVPRGLSVSLGAEQFDAINAVNVEDLMKYAPNFFVRKRFAGDDNAVVALRGANTVQSARTIVLVDGFLVSNFLGNRWDFPPKWNVVGPAEVQQFDIVYGPYSARYNGHSMGGIVSVTTREPDQTSAYAVGQRMVMPFEEYGFDETFTGLSAEAGFAYKPEGSPWSFRLSARHFENTGQSMTYNLLTPATGSATVVNGAYVDPRLATPVFGAASPVDVTQDQVRARLSYLAGSGWKVDALALAWLSKQQLLDTRTWLTSATDGSPVRQGRVSFNGRVWNATGLNLSTSERTEYLTGIKAEGDLGGWATAVNLSRFWIADGDARTSRDFATGVADGPGTQTRSGEPGWYAAETSFVRDFDRHRLAFGAGGSLYETASDTFTTSDWRRAATPVFSTATYGKTANWGAWLEDEVQVDAWRVTAGIRADGWRAYDGGIAKTFAARRVDDRYKDRRESSISPKLSATRRLSDAIDLQVSLGQATRFPTVGELYQGRFDDITRAIDPQSYDPDLKAEKSDDLNVMLRYRGAGMRATASLFLQDIDDAIFSFSGLNQFGTVVSGYKNVDRVRQYGLELILEASGLLVEGLDLDANVAWTSAETLRNTPDPRAEGKQFPRIPEWRSNGNLRYRLMEPLRLSLGWRYASRPNSDLLGLVRGDAYGFQTEYLTVDTRLSWDINDGLQLNAGIDNLFNDQAYVSHPLPQRTWVFDLKAKW